jgi:predicted negative regulator of RcsB-dependent stress response
VKQGLTTVNEVLRTLDQPGDYLWDAELYRLKGELVLASGVQGPASRVQKNQKSKGKRQKAEIPNTPHPIPSTSAEAEACFLKAIEIARRQQAKSLELRATMSLARLGQQQGKQTEAHQMLSEIYHWFTEGFDTKDLQEAKALLDSLGSSV